MTLTIVRGGMELEYAKPIDLLSDEQLTNYLLSLSKNEQERIARLANRSREAKYPHSKRRTPIYGNLPRGLSAATLYKFNAQVSDIHDLRRFLAMQIYGLRCGEVAKAKVVPHQGLIVIDNKKGSRHGENRHDYLPLIPGTECLFLPGGNRHYRHLARVFDKVCEAIGEEMLHQYGTSKLGRPLFQFSTHSMRHTASNIFFQYTNNEFKTAQFLRHRQYNRIGVTSQYIRYPIDAMREDMARAFAPLIRDWVR